MCRLRRVRRNGVRLRGDEIPGEVHGCSFAQNIRPEFGVKRRRTPTRVGVRPQMAQSFAPFGSDITLGVTPHEN